MTAKSLTVVALPACQPSSAGSGRSTISSSPTILCHSAGVLGEQFAMPHLVDFCFPNARDLDSRAEDWLGVPTETAAGVPPFAFILTAVEDGPQQIKKTQYCCCQYVYPSGNPADGSPAVCLCLLSRYPFFQLHFHVLAQLAAAFDSSKSGKPGQKSAGASYETAFFEDEGMGLLGGGSTSNDLDSFFGTGPPAPAAPAVDPFAELSR